MLFGVVQMDKKIIFGICMFLLILISPLVVQAKIWETSATGIEEMYVQGTTTPGSFDCKGCISEGVQLDAHFILDSDINCGTIDTVRQVGGSLECSNVSFASDSATFGNSNTDWEMLLYSSLDSTYGRFYWWGDKAAIALGYVDFTHESVGDYSVSIGYSSNAVGTGGVCLGTSIECNGNYSFSASGDGDFGDYNVALAGGVAGFGTDIALGNCNTTMYDSICIGTGIATGDSSISIGDQNEAQNDYSLVMGYYTIASAQSAHALGTYCTVAGIDSFGFCGYGNSAHTINDPDTFAIRRANFSVDTDVLFIDQEHDKIGINTKVPDTELDVRGTLEIRETDDGNPSIELIPSTSYSEIIFYNIGAPTMWFNSSNKTYFPLDDLGIGTTAPTADLDINGQLIIANANASGQCNDITDATYCRMLAFTNSTWSIASAILELKLAYGSSLTFVFLNGLMEFYNGSGSSMGGFDSDGHFYVGDDNCDLCDGIGDLYVDDELETDDLYLTGNIYASKPSMYLTLDTYLAASHDCDDTPSNCCDAGYHMCTISEFLEGGRRIENDKGLNPTYAINGYVDPLEDSEGADCGGWESGSGYSTQCYYNYIDAICTLASACDGNDNVWCCSD